MNIEELRKIRNWEYKKELDKVREELNKKYFGFKDWYDFSVANWGTKWDIGRDGAYSDTLRIKDIKDKTVTFYFDSAWCPPIKAYEKLIEMGFSIRAMYYEGGCCFCGIWEDGQEEFYEIEGKSEWVQENIPKDLDYAFNISEGMAEWEAENAEEEENAEA